MKTISAVILTFIALSASAETFDIRSPDGRTVHVFANSVDGTFHTSDGGYGYSSQSYSEYHTPNGTYSAFGPLVVPPANPNANDYNQHGDFQGYMQ